MVKTDCPYCDSLTFECKKAHPGVICDYSACVSYYPSDGERITGPMEFTGIVPGFKIDREECIIKLSGYVKTVSALEAAAMDLVDAVERYVVQDCLRSELIGRKDTLKKKLQRYEEDNVQ